MKITVEHLSKSFGKAEVLRDISFSLSDEEILGVIGPSGGGKSTLLRCLDVLEEIDSGRILYHTGKSYIFDSQDGPTEIKACEMRKHIGFVFQGFNLWEEKSVLENLTLAPRIVLNISRSKAEETAREHCQRFGLFGKLNSRAWQLSGGEKQRVAFIRSLMMQPRLLLLDEVTSALDPVLTVDVMESIRHLRSNGMSMIIVTHHIEFASTLCDRIMFLSHGEIVQLDTPNILIHSPASDEVRRFLAILREAR